MESKPAAQVCVPICEASLSDLASTMDQAVTTADLVELRLDCLEPSELNDFNPAAFERATKPIILTLRSPDQGGHTNLTSAERLQFWTRWLKHTKRTYLDIESDLLPSITAAPELDFTHVIVSQHDFSGVPNNLVEIFEALMSSPARIGKIAVTARDVTDCLPVFDLLKRDRAGDKELIAIAMGPAGIMTRILGPSRGGFLTYAALTQDSGTAPGQATAHDLRSVYRIDKIDRDTFVCGIIGLPVMHSVSPHMHNAALAAHGLNGVYLPLEVRDVDSFFRRMVKPQAREFDWDLRGLSVTAPHKSTVLRHLDYVDEKAKKIGAVNTILVKEGKLHGYNTDADGFLQPLLERVPSLAGLRVGVLGAGGSARAVLWALTEQRADTTLFARDVVKGQALGSPYKIPVKDLGSASFENFDLVINTTPLGSSGNLVAQTPATIEQLTGAKLAYDLVYNPSETKFIANARSAGCDVLSGLDMLVAQAKLQFEIWTGLTPETSTMLVAAQRALHSQKI